MNVAFRMKLAKYLCCKFRYLQDYCHFVSNKITKWTRIAAGFVLIFLISCAHEFTSKLWHMNPASSSIVFMDYYFLLDLSFLFKFKRKWNVLLQKRVCCCRLWPVIFVIVQYQTHSFLTVLATHSHNRIYRLSFLLYSGQGKETMGR